MNETGKSPRRTSNRTFKNSRSPLAPVVGHPEDVPVRGLGMVEERGLDPPEPARDLQLPLVPHAALISEDEESVLAHVAHDLFSTGVGHGPLQVDAAHQAADLVRSQFVKLNGGHVRKRVKLNTTVYPFQSES